MEQITNKTLEQAMANVNGASFVSIDTVTVPVLAGGKKNPMQGRVTKHAYGCSVMVFQNKTTNAYENMVKRRLLSEGKDPETFELSARAWGVRRPNSPFVDHKDEVYLEVIFLRAPTKVEYKLDGVVIDKDQIEGLKEDEPAADSQGGLNNKVIIRTFKASSIKKVRVDHVEYVM